MAHIEKPKIKKPKVNLKLQAEKKEKKIKELLKVDTIIPEAKPHSHDTRKNAKKYTITTPIVQEYARFRAVPQSLRPDGYVTNNEFLKKHGYSENSIHILTTIQQIPGFWELKQKYAKQYHAFFVSVADENMLKLAEGIKVQEQVWDFENKCYKDEVFEKPPNFKALEFIKKCWDGFQEKGKFDIDLSIQQKWIQAAKDIKAENGNDNGDDNE